jgi:SAM-dependent methyltransferase
MSTGSTSNSHFDGSGGGKAAVLYADGLAMRPLRRAVAAFADSRARAGAKVLDYGCGTEPYRALFEARGATCIAADIDAGHDLQFVPDQPLPLEAATFDCVVSFQVLEHVRDVPLYLREARRVLKDGGSFLLSTHGTWPYHPHPQDFWRWTREGLRTIVEEAGFEIRSITPVCGPAAWLAMFPLLVGKRLLGRAELLLSPINLAVNVVAGLADAVTPAGVRDYNAAIYVIDAGVPS